LVHIFISLLLFAAPTKSLEVHSVAVPPRIDGRIEEVWAAADSATGFVQAAPDEGDPETERTVVYVLQDENNLYVAFRCWASRRPQVAQLYGVEDEATFYISPTESSDMGYFFKVYGSGLYHDGLLLDGGADQDWSWDCVWYNSIRHYPDRFEVEMRIPFKSIRYKPGTTSWRCNADRYVAMNVERDYWQYTPDREGGVTIANSGLLTGMAPRSHGYYLELYPEAFVRYDSVPPAEGTFKTSASLNVKWDLTPQTSLNATVLPDFAQIEGDPYSVNLSRYPTLLAERRPFFIEGSEFFRMTGLGDGSFTPLRIFYSRRIGKAIRQQPVPILGGLKFTSRFGGTSFGALGAYTQSLTDTSLGIAEPPRAFAVLSGRTPLPDGNRLGLIFAGTEAGSQDYNFALGSDWSFARGPHRGAFQAALSDRDGKVGWALNSGYSGMLGNIVANSAFEVTDDSFDVTDIGYVPWAGRVRFNASAGPLFTTRGAMRRLTVMPSVGFNREPGATDLSYFAGVGANPQFRNGWGAYLYADAGRTADADTLFPFAEWNVSVWGGDIKYNVNLNASGGRAWNYQRGYLAWNYNDNVSFTYYLAGRVALMLGLFNGWELDPANRLACVTTAASPRIDFRINSKMSFNVYNEMVLLTPAARFDSTEFYSNRAGFLFSWNFLPKSWLYVALNDFRVADFGDPSHPLKLADLIGAVKVRYLFYI
jgi:hypothetical protein